jgi:hypothetical protein
MPQTFIDDVETGYYFNSFFREKNGKKIAEAAHEKAALKRHH